MARLVFLKTDQDFAAFRSSKSFQTKLLKIRVRWVLNQNTPRFGFIVPKKVMPMVVDRNLIKRRIKSILSSNIAKIKPADMVFYPQKDLLKKTFDEVSAEVEELFSKAKLWK